MTTRARTRHLASWRLASAALIAVAANACAPASRAAPSPDHSPAEAIHWRRAHHETFDAPFPDPPWVEDTYGAASPYHVDAFSEDGAFFAERGGAAFAASLARFRSFRRASRYGEDGWLTVELYGRDSDRDGVPETGGRFVSVHGVARLISTRHYDGAIIRSTDPLPPRYRVEVTVGNIRFGGARDGQWVHDGKVNGYDGDEVADPWFFRDDDPAPRSATTQNGLYFLCITDYPRPAPHNNVFIHHHRKVVMDTDNNESGVAPGATSHGPWSQVWNPRTQRGEPEGSHYVSMLWLDGRHFGHDWFGNDFVSYTPGGWQTDAPIFTDEYLDGERYRFTIERDGERYTMSVTGRFRHGGSTTYRGSRRFRDAPVTWHYNQAADEYAGEYDEVRRYGGEELHTWPAGSGYPDYFFFGDPHINFYEGTAEFDDLDLYLPADAPAR